MSTKKSGDSWANVAAVKVDETAAGTLTSEKFAFPFSIMDKMGIVIQRLEYFPAGLASLNSTGDEVQMALMSKASVVDIGVQSDPAIIDSQVLTRLDLGTSASGFLFNRVITRDFTTLAGGGILVAPGALYAGVKSSGAAAPMGFWLRMYYTYMTLSADEYWQLVESRNVITS